MAALTPLPSAIWRLTLVFGASGGYTDAGLVELGVGDAAGRAYLVALSVLTEVAALLTLGLVSRWGEVVPRWVPRWGGRTLNRRAVTAVAGTGAALLILMWTPNLFWWTLEHPDLTEQGRLIIGLLYLPLVAWGPLLAAVTVAYRRRGSPGRPTSSR